MFSQTIAVLIAYVNQFDTFLASLLESHNFTRNLLITTTGRYISELILVSSVLLLTYETIYWFGIYRGWWEYHAKDIFKEIPVHCAHVYVRLNVAERSKLPDVEEYFRLLQKSKYNLFNWNTIAEAKTKGFLLDDFVKYHFEFSPDDFEMNPDPDYGSTIEHLRQKTLNLFNSSDLYDRFKPRDPQPSDVHIYNRRKSLVGRDKDQEYLVKCSIETGDTIDCIVVLP